MNRIIKYILIVLPVFLIIFFSLDIENLQKYNDRVRSVEFDAVEFASNFWEEDLPRTIDEAVSISELFKALGDNPEEAFQQYGYKLGISSTGYFFMRGEGQIVSIDEEYIVIDVDEKITVRLATEYIFGNAVRDGSGKVDINEFVNMTNFNSTSVEINKQIKGEVVPRLLNIAEPGKSIEFAGAAEIVEKQISLDSLAIIPVMVDILGGSRK